MLRCQDAMMHYEINGGRLRNPQFRPAIRRRQIHSLFWELRSLPPFRRLRHI